MPYQQYNFKPQTFDAQKKRPDLRLLYISHSSYDKTWPSVLHSHPFTELFYVLNGTGTFQTETQTFCIAADDLILINPMSCTQNSATAMRLWNMLFSDLRA